MLRPDENSVIWGAAKFPGRMWIMALLGALLVIASSSQAQESLRTGGSDPAGETAPTRQDSPDAEAPSTRVPRLPTVQGPLTPAGPDTFILLDAEGRPHPILGMTYEEFDEAWKKLRGLDDASAEPEFVLKSMTAKGRVDGDAAVLDVRLEIEVRSTGMTEVPLGFAGAILRQFDEATTSLQLSYDQQRGGYLAWVRGADPQTLVVNLPLIVPLKRDGDRITLQTNVPRALTNQIVLNTPTRIVSPVVSEGAIVRLADQGNGTRIMVTGLVGDVVLSWQPAGAEDTEARTVLRVQGQITTSVDGRGARSEARLRVEGFGGKFQQLRLRLPPGAQLVPQGPMELPEAQPAYKLIPASSPSSRIEGGVKRRGQVYVVEFAEATAGPIDVRLATDQPIGLTSENALTELAGFEVLGAVRQYGELALRVDSDWQIRWGRITGGRQISTDELDQELTDEQSLYAFEYDQQPWSLPIEVNRRDTRVTVSPKYRLELTPEEARLRVTLQYQVAGSEERKFWVNLAGWHITSETIEPTRMIDSDLTREINADQLLFTPEDIVQKSDKQDVSKNTFLELTLNQPASRRTEITFHLRRQLDELEGSLRLPLPIPRADSIGTGELVVLADPRLLVTPSANQEGLTAPPVTSETELSTDSGLTPVATYRSFLDRLVFSADVKPRPGEVQASIHSTITFDSQSTDVDHVLSFDARYQPLNELELLVPAALWRDQTLRLTLLPGNGEAGASRESEGVPLSIRASTSNDNLDPSTELIRVTLPQPRLGRFRLRAVYFVPASADRTNSLDPLVVPLIIPSQVAVVSQTATVSGRGLADLELTPGKQKAPWFIADSSNSHPIDQIDLESSERPTTELALQFHPKRIANEGRTVVDHAWLQTWIAASTQQQRVVYRLQSNDSDLRIELPPSSARRDVEVVLDNQPLLKFERGEAQLVVPLSESSEPMPHTLELRYLEERGLTPWDELHVELPQVGGETQLAQFSWSVVVPRNYWVVQGPNALARGFDWRWSLIGLEPVALESTGDLEAATQARGRRQPSAGEAEYLYTGMGPGSSLTIQVMRSELVLLAIATGALAAGMALLFLPMMRRPPFLLGATIALIFAGAAYPELMLIGGPALALGGTLALLSGLLYLLVPRREVIESTATSSTFLGTQPTIKEKFYAGPGGTVSTNAPTVALHHSESNA